MYAAETIRKENAQGYYESRVSDCRTFKPLVENYDDDLAFFRVTWCALSKEGLHE